MSQTRRESGTLRQPRSSARIAADRARRPRAGRPARSGAAERAERSPPKRAAPATKTQAKPKGNTARRPRGAAEGPRRHSLITMLLAMVVLGFGSVYLIDGVSRFLNQGKVGDYATSELWDKLVSRMLDRDVPRPSRPTPKVIPAPEPVAAPVSAPEKRAELRAERPEAYARQSRTLDQVRGAQRDEPSRRRIDAILEKAGVKAD